MLPIRILTRSLLNKAEHQPLKHAGTGSKESLWNNNPDCCWGKRKETSALGSWAGAEFSIPREEGECYHGRLCGYSGEEWGQALSGIWLKQRVNAPWNEVGVYSCVCCTTLGLRSSNPKISGNNPSPGKRWMEWPSGLWLLSIQRWHCAAAIWVCRV